MSNVLETGDMPKFAVNGASRERLADAMRLAIGNSTLWGWRELTKEGHPAIGLMQYKETGGIPFLTPLGPHAVAEELFAWLGIVKRTVGGYPPQPDHDGSNEAGWSLTTGPWGCIDGDRAVVLLFQPEWIMYGK